MEAKSYGMQFSLFEKLISHWSRLRFLLAVHPCDHAVDSFPKWYDTWKSAQKWGRESHFFNLVTFLTNTKKFKNPWLGAPGPFFGLFQWCQGMFLKVPEGFQRKKFSSCAETKLVPINTSEWGVYSVPIRSHKLVIAAWSCLLLPHLAASDSGGAYELWADIIIHRKN